MHRFFSHAAALALLASAAQAQQTPQGYYASGWPIALAEAACAGDEGCLTQLANCGPNDPTCIQGVALCTRREGGQITLQTACRTDTLMADTGKAVLATLPDGATYTLFLPDTGMAGLNDMTGSRSAPDCFTAPDSQLSFCATPLVTEADFQMWRDTLQ